MTESAAFLEGHSPEEVKLTEIITRPSSPALAPIAKTPQSRARKRHEKFKQTIYSTSMVVTAVEYLVALFHHSPNAPVVHKDASSMHLAESIFAVLTEARLEMTSVVVGLAFMNHIHENMRGYLSRHTTGSINPSASEKISNKLSGDPLLAFYKVACVCFMASDALNVECTYKKSDWADIVQLPLEDIREIEDLILPSLPTSIMLTQHLWLGWISRLRNFNRALDAQFPPTHGPVVQDTLDQWLHAAFRHNPTFVGPCGRVKRKKGAGKEEGRKVIRLSPSLPNARVSSLSMETSQVQLTAGERKRTLSTVARSIDASRPLTKV